MKRDPLDAPPDSMDRRSQTRRFAHWMERCISPVPMTPDEMIRTAPGWLLLAAKVKAR